MTVDESSVISNFRKEVCMTRPKIMRGPFECGSISTTSTAMSSIKESSASRNAESANNWIERSSSMRKLNQFMKFDWEAFAKGKRFLCVGGGKWVD